MPSKTEEYLALAAHHGVRHIENVVQAWESAGFIQQSDALRATPDIAVHSVLFQTS